MEAVEKSGVESPLSQYLHDALGKAEAGDYTEALSLLKPAKSLEPRNVYILAFEKQLEQLIEFKQRNVPSDDQRTDIMESLPGIIERALEGASAQIQEPGAPVDQQAVERDREKSVEERAAAFEWLKNQYFQHAHEHVRKGEFQNALGEIRRVYIIDPGNKVAHDFERQIQLASKLQEERIRVQEPPAPAAKPPAAPATPAPVPGAPPVSASETEIIPTKTEEWSSPPAPYPVTLRGHAAEAEKEKDSSRMIMILLLIVVLFAIGAGLFFWARQNAIRKGMKEPAGGLAEPVEQYYAARDEAAEQTYFVTSYQPGQGTMAPQVTDVPAGSPAEKPRRGGERRERDASSTPQAAVPSAAADGSVRNADVERVSPAPVKSGAPPEAAAPGQSEANLSPVAVEKSPEVVKLERPQFPNIVYAKGLSGQVIVQVQINIEGKPIKARILRSTNPLLDGPVIEAVMKSKFLPGQMSSGPVTSWLSIPFRFEESH